MPPSATKVMSPVDRDAAMVSTTTPLKPPKRQATPFRIGNRGHGNTLHVGTPSDHLSLAWLHLCQACASCVSCRDDSGMARDNWEEEEDPEILKARQAGVFVPTDRWKEGWDMIVLVLIIYSAIFVPYRICFSAHAVGYWFYFEQAQTALFLIDVIFNFNTSFQEEDRWVTSRAMIAGRYLQGWFWIDFPASVPIELLDYFAGAQSEQWGMLRFLRLFRLLRLLRLLKMGEYVADLEDKFEVNLASLRIAQMLLKLIFLAHILACFWFYSAALVGFDEGLTTWVSEYEGGYLIDTPPSVQYLTSIYWALTTLTTVGYGDIIPTSNVERSYTIVSLLLGALVFGYMLSSIASLVAALDRQAAISEEKMDEIKEYMRWRKLPRDLSVRMRRYYENVYSGAAVFDEGAILGGLTANMRLEVVRHVIKDTIGRITVLVENLDLKMQVQIFHMFKPIHVRIGGGPLPTRCNCTCL